MVCIVIVVASEVILQTFSPVSLLTGPHWLNDQIMTFYFEYLSSQTFKADSKRILFVSPPVVQLIKLAPDDFDLFLGPSALNAINKDIIFFPVNNHEGSGIGGAHWSLLVYVKKEQTFFSFDSMGNRNEVATKALVTVVREGLKVPLEESMVVRSLQQRNYYDCGIFVLANAEHVCRHFLATGNVEDVPILSQQAALRKRQDMLTIIEDLTKKDGDDAAGPSWLEMPRRERKVACYTPVLFYREQGLEKKWSDLTKLEKGFYISELNDLNTAVPKKLSQEDVRLMKAFQKHIGKEEKADTRKRKQDDRDDSDESGKPAKITKTESCSIS